MSQRPRIVGYAIVSREGMIANSDGSFPDDLKIPADQKFYQDSVDRAAAVANGRHSAEGGPKEAARRLEIAPKTADNHIQSLYSKIGVSTRAAAALYALERGLIQHGISPA